MISFKQFLIENEILEDDDAPKDGVTLYYGKIKGSNTKKDFVAVEYKDGELVNVFEKMGFNGVFPFDSKGKITNSAEKRSNQIIKSIEKMSGNSITKKVEMYLRETYSKYDVVLKNTTLKKFYDFIKDYLDSIVKRLQSLVYRHGIKYYDYIHYDLEESEYDQFEEEVKFIKNFIKKHLR